MKHAVFLSLVAGCISTWDEHDDPQLCDGEAIETTVDDDSFLGFSAREMLDLYTAERSHWEVGWSGSQAGGDQIAFDVQLQLVGATEIHQSEHYKEIGCSHRLEAEVFARIESVDGELTSEGPAVLWAIALPDAVLSLSHETDDPEGSLELGPRIRAARDAVLEPDWQLDSTHFGANGKYIGLWIGWSSPGITDNGTASVYKCSNGAGEDERCFVMSGSP